MNRNTVQHEADPEGSIFLPKNPEVQRKYFALLLGRGAYSGLSLQESLLELARLQTEV